MKMFCKTANCPVTSNKIQLMLRKGELTLKITHVILVRDI